jgi:predicted O-methyltransferase YrrM
MKRAYKLLNLIHNKSPTPLKEIEKKANNAVFSGNEENINREFIHKFIGKEKFKDLSDEFERKKILEKIDTKKSEFYSIVDSENLSFGSISSKEAKILYALVREQKPEKLVETGVCNGVSTWIILEGLKENGEGRLYSIDYPFYTNESLEMFRDETFDGYGGAAIPEGRKPGWIIPDQLRENWELIEGKSQEKLPELLLELEEIDFFMHDSEHSTPCMIFEYELALNNLKNNGLIISDDITWNNAFEIFKENREVNSETISGNIGLFEPNGS